MFRIHLKFAVRNLIRYRTYSLLNIAGLSIGLALGIFVMLYVTYGYGYDKIHKNGARMYKLLAFIKQADNKSFTDYRQSVLIGDALKQGNSEIESYNRISFTSVFFKVGENRLEESGIFADTNFFKFYDFPLVSGDPVLALNDPGNIVLSEHLAKKLLPGKNAVGQIITVLLNHQLMVFKVSGIFKDIDHSTINFDFVLPFSKLLSDNPSLSQIKTPGCECMFLLKPNTDINGINNKIKDFLKDKDDTSNKTLFLQPFWEMYLYHYIDGVRHKNKLLIILLMSIFAGLILIISAFNFINMSIAIGIKRYREAGIKKVMGSSKRSVSFQFLIESVIICMFALFFAFILLETFLPVYNQIDNLKLAVDYTNPGQLILFLSFAILVGVVSALYPSILLASTPSLKILRGESSRKQRIGKTRQGLIVFQFLVTILLLEGLFVFRQQSLYIEKKDIGIVKDHVLYFQASDDLMKHREALQTELSGFPEVKSLSWNSQLPVRLFSSTTDVVWEGKQPNEKMDFWTIETDSAFFSTFQPRLSAGRIFSPALVTDTDTYIINEEAVRCMHLKEPIGKVISLNGNRGTVIGVVKNFNSLHLNIPYLPVVILYKPSKATMLFLKYTGDLEAFKKKVEKVCKKYNTDTPVNSRTLDQAYNDINRFAQNGFQVLTALSFLAIFLACMGLFGLASFTIETRTKEIGIRKVNGASTWMILRMFLKTYHKWIVIASVIGLPLGGFMWNGFLSSVFAFRAPFPSWSLVATPLLVLLVAWLTVIVQSWEAANKNPVDALRYE